MTVANAAIHSSAPAFVNHKQSGRGVLLSSSGGESVVVGGGGDSAMR